MTKSATRKSAPKRSHMNNKIKELHDFCQTFDCPPALKRNVIRAKAEELAGARVKIIKASLETIASRGIFVSGANKEHSLNKIAEGNPLIVLARDLNRCWERLVQTKELMHLFDSDHEKTATATDFEKLLNDFAVPTPGDDSPQMSSEVKALIMALACLCPEKARAQFKADCEKGHIDHYGIALQLRVPTLYVPLVLSDRFSDMVAKCWE